MLELQLLGQAQPSSTITWVDYLKGQISPLWRPGEFDFEQMHFVPDPGNPLTYLRICDRNGCEIRLQGGALCPSCRLLWKAAELEGATFESWNMTPRTRIDLEPKSCLVDGCRRSRHTQGLCHSHTWDFQKHVKLDGSHPSAEEWALSVQPRQFEPMPTCSIVECVFDGETSLGLCHGHHNTFTGSQRRRTKRNLPLQTVEVWARNAFEPALSPKPYVSYASMAATPFFMLPEPLRSEWVYAIQRRDLNGRAHFNPSSVRGYFKDLIKSELTTVVGMKDLGLAAGNSNTRALIAEWQFHIDAAHRQWSGVDNRDPDVIWLSDIEQDPNHLQRSGPKARIDLSDYHHDWLKQSFSSWVFAVPRHPAHVRQANLAWGILDQVLTARATPKRTLGNRDMDAVVLELRRRWPTGRVASSCITIIERILSHSRTDEKTSAVWAEVPSAFLVNRVRHKSFSNVQHGRQSDDSFRYIPQPIVDWMMDHLSWFNRPDPYATAEARVMIFVHERCGRRSGETLRLSDDCISYDSVGDPYLEWNRGKAPYGKGKRIPIHQETHDVIRDWQSLKREHGIESAWLFPSRSHSSADKHNQSSHLSKMVKEFAKFVAAEWPYEGTVEDVEGNLIHFDITSIDSYAFRHAFAQRLADATDGEGRSTTPPEVLQEYMGHKNFETTMAYFRVTQRRKKRALEAIPPRRLSSMGQAVAIDRERDSFTRVAVTLGHCTEPHNVTRGGHGCVIDHACESCPFFFVDPLERDGLAAKRDHLKIKLERARVVNSPTHILDHFVARIDDCSRIIAGIDSYVTDLPAEERASIEDALNAMADVRRRATASRTIDIRPLLTAMRSS